jgi:hypothetical protein
MVSIDSVITPATSVAVLTAIVAILNLVTAVVSIVAKWLCLREAHQSKRQRCRGSRSSLAATEPEGEMLHLANDEKRARVVRQIVGPVERLQLRDATSDCAAPRSVAGTSSRMA